MNEMMTEISVFVNITEGTSYLKIRNEIYKYVRFKNKLNMHICKKKNNIIIKE